MEEKSNKRKPDAKPKGFKNDDDFPPIPLIIHTWLCKKYPDMDSYSEWLRVRFDNIVKACKFPPVDDTKELDRYYARTPVRGKVWQALTAFLDTKYTEDRKFFCSVTLREPETVHMLTMQGLLITKAGKVYMVLVQGKEPVYCSVVPQTHLNSPLVDSRFNYLDTGYTPTIKWLLGDPLQGGVKLRETPHLLVWCKPPPVSRAVDDCEGQDRRAKHGKEEEPDSDYTPDSDCEEGSVSRITKVARSDPAPPVTKALATQQSRIPMVSVVPRPPMVSMVSGVPRATAAIPAPALAKIQAQAKIQVQAQIQAQAKIQVQAQIQAQAKIQVQAQIQAQAKIQAQAQIQAPVRQVEEDLRQKEILDRMMQYFQQLTPSFRNDFMERAGLQPRAPPVPKTNDIPLAEVKALTEGPVNHDLKLRTRLEAMKAARIEAGLIGFPFPPKPHGDGLLIPDYIAKLLEKCRITKHIPALIETLNDSFLIWMCIERLLRFHPCTEQTGKKPASIRVNGALDDMEGLWALSLDMGGGVVKSGAYFDIDHQTFRCFEDTRLFALGTPDHRQAHADSLAKYRAIGYPESLAHRLAFICFMKHPAYPVWRALRYADPAVLDWLRTDRSETHVHRILASAFRYPPNVPVQAVPVTRSSAQLMGYGSGDDASDYENCAQVPARQDRSVPLFGSI